MFLHFVFRLLPLKICSFLQYHGAHVYTDSYVNKDSPGLNHRNCVASCTRLMLYSHLDNNDDDDDNDDDKIMIIIIITIVAR